MMQSVHLFAAVVLGLVVLIVVAMSGEEKPANLAAGGLSALTETTPAVEGPGDLAVDETRQENGTFGVHIRRPAGAPLVRFATDSQGGVAEAACSTCHSIRKPNFENTTSASLDEFHQGLQVSHGKLVCYACHHSDDSDSLRTADGRALPYQEVMTLCSQCHGPQASSFARGAHGGMTGFWDLSKGPQVKNNCIDCHDPHAPRYPSMVVNFKPRDRFLEVQDSHDDH